MKPGVTQNRSTQSQLIRLAIDDANQEAVDRLLQGHRPRLVRFVMRWVGNIHDAEDIAQVTLTKAHAALQNFDTDMIRPDTVDSEEGRDDCLEKRFAGWLDRIAFRSAVDFVRRNSKVKTVQVDSLESGFALAELAQDAKAEYREANRLFAFAKTHLNEKQYAALYFCYVDGLTMAETATRMESSSIAIRALMFRARRALKSAMKKHGFNHE
jgi:RNA polymerase sigma factor (sigma-70 family)